MLTGGFAAPVCPFAHDRRYSRLCVIADVTSPRPVIRRGKIRTAPSHVAEYHDPTVHWFGLDPLFIDFSASCSRIQTKRSAGDTRPCWRESIAALHPGTTVMCRAHVGCGNLPPISAPSSPYAIRQFRHIPSMASMPQSWILEVFRLTENCPDYMAFIIGTLTKSEICLQTAC